MTRVTFVVDDDLIKRARSVAHSEGTTLNAAFSAWLRTYARPVGSARKYESLMKRLRHVRARRRLARDEMNER